MIEVYSPNNDNIGIVYRAAGTLGILEELHLPSGDTLSSSMVSASHAAGVITQMTGVYTRAENVIDMLRDSTSFHLPIKEDA